MYNLIAYRLQREMLDDSDAVGVVYSRNFLMVILPTPLGYRVVVKKKKYPATLQLLREIRIKIGIASNER
jgi:hypothetical protein